MARENTDSKPHGSIEDHYGKRLSVEEFLVDFLGGLVPGVLFIVATFFSLSPAMHALSTSLSLGHKDTNFFKHIALAFEYAKDTPSAIWIIGFIGAVLLAYIVGHLFYRHDLKSADRSSFRRLAKVQENDTDDKRRANLGCASENECEFPYPYYHKYLEQRGLYHLVPFVLWQEKEKKNFRSKTYVNLLKTRLRHFHPEKCGTVIRNEAHVRLASSTWYVSFILAVIGWICFFISAFSFIISIIRNKWEEISFLASWHLPSITFPIILIILCMFFRKTISGFLHYQRLREVFFVLETAFTSFSGKLYLLDPPFKIIQSNEKERGSINEEGIGQDEGDDGVGLDQVDFDPEGKNE